VESIDIAEDRDKFLRLLEELRIPIPEGSTAYSAREAKAIANRIGYPVLVRPSYVLGGRAMEIVYNDRLLEEYMKMAVDLSAKHPVLIDKYVNGIEAEVDGICDCEDVLIPGIFQHIERAGVHSGDSIAVYPPHTLSREIKDVIADYSIRLAKALKIVGLFNIQFVIDSSGEVYVIEVNPRASRTVPIMSKITGIPMVNVATKLIMGGTLRGLGYEPGLAKESAFTAVKAPVFSFSKLLTVDTFLSPEMKSTGEVMGVDKDYRIALYKALIASGLSMPRGGNVLIATGEWDRDDCITLSKRFSRLGFNLMAVEDDYYCLNDAGLLAELVPEDMILDYIKTDKVSLVISTHAKAGVPGRLGFAIRRTSMEYNIPCLTSLDTANAILDVLEHLAESNEPGIYALDEYSRYNWQAG
jgi:carbamoyl-phosphate synthase large subunit